MIRLRACGATARRRTFGVVIVVSAVSALSADVYGHRLDEYLQAARLSLGPEGVALELDLTPGVAVAPDIIARVDRDRDATITPLEARAYADTVLSDIVLTLDGRRVALTLDRVEVSPAGELRDGVGTIQLRASSPGERLTAGEHELQFRNNHHPGAAAYLVNALAPDDRTLRVLSQVRDPSQREARIAYEVSAPSMQWLWLLAGVACFHRPVASALRQKFQRPHPSA